MFYMSKTHRGNNYCVSLALTLYKKKASDTLIRLGLWAFLRKYGCPKCVVEMIEALQSSMMELGKQGIFNVWLAAQAFGDEIHQVSIIVKYIV